MSYLRSPDSRNLNQQPPNFGASSRGGASFYRSPAGDDPLAASSGSYLGQSVFQRSQNQQSNGFQPRDTLSSQNSQPLRYSQSQLQQQRLVSSSQNVEVVRVSQNESAAPGDVREKIISTYRREIAVQPQREKDFKQLSDLIADLQRRVKSMEGYLDDSQREQEDYLSSQQKVITHHQGEIETLRKTILDREQEGVKIYDEITATKRQVEDRDSEIYQANRDIEAVRKANEQLRREVEFVNQDIHQGQDAKKRQQQAIYQLKNDLRF